MATDGFTVPQAHKEKMMAMEIADKIDAVMEDDKTKCGALLCEGLENSVDYALYSEVYSHLFVIPSNGCSDVLKMLPRVRKFSEYPVFGLIDRDSMSKKKIKQLANEKGVYTTKLPFIENIICCPEVLKLICKRYQLDYQLIIKTIRESLTSILAEKLMLLNPFNIELPQGQEIQKVVVTIISKCGAVNKQIDLNNVMYTFRDKSIVNEVANAISARGKSWYYEFIKEEIKSPSGGELVFIMSKYLPIIKVNDY